MLQEFKAIKQRARQSFVILVVMVVMSQPAFAQWEMDELLNHIDNFNGLIGQFCDVGDQAAGYVDTGEAVGSAINWICAMQPSIQRARDMATAFNKDVSGFFSDALGNGFDMLLSATGFELGGTDLAGLLQDGITDIASGEFSMAEWMGRALGQINSEALEALAAPPDAGASELEATATNAARADPMRMEREVQAIQRRSSAMLQAAQTQDTANMAQKLAASSLARGDEERIMRRVTNPNPVDGKPGTADLAQTRGKEANSSRAAIQGLVQAQADYMRQDAVSTANLVTAMKEQASQQVFTTQQLSSLAQTLGAQQMEEYNDWREEYFGELGAAMAKADELKGNFAMVAEILRSGQ